MLLKSRAFAQALLGSMKRGQHRPRYVDIVISVQDMPELNVSQRKIISTKTGVPGKLRLYKSQLFFKIMHRTPDRIGILIRNRCPHDAPENRQREGLRNIELRPLRPPIHLRARHRVRRPECPGSISPRQLPQDCSRFPKRRINAVLQDRNRAVRVEPPERLCVHPAVDVSDVMSLIPKLQLSDAPHQRLHIGRTRPAPDGQHAPSSQL